MAFILFMDFFQKCYIINVLDGIEYDIVWKSIVTAD